MIRASLVLAASLAFIPAASAGPDTDFPHRDWGQVAILDMTLADATSCIARAMDRDGAVLVLPVDGGNDIDFSPGTMFGGSTNEPFLRFKVRESGDASTMRLFYRHPVRKKLAGRYVEKLQKRCLKVRSIDPATE